MDIRVEWVRLLCGKVIEGPVVQSGIICLFLVAISRFVSDSKKGDSAFETLDLAFLIEVLVEIGMQLCPFEDGLSIFGGGWLEQ
jgi:hypothetical protein